MGGDADSSQWQVLRLRTTCQMLRSSQKKLWTYWLRNILPYTHSNDFSNPDNFYDEDDLSDDDDSIVCSYMTDVLYLSVV